MYILTYLISNNQENVTKIGRPSLPMRRMRGSKPYTVTQFGVGKMHCDASRIGTRAVKVWCTIRNVQTRRERAYIPVRARMCAGNQGMSLCRGEVEQGGAAAQLQALLLHAVTSLYEHSWWSTY